MASLPLLRPSPSSLMHHRSSSSSSSSSSSFDRIKKPYYLSGYSSILRSPPSTTILRVSSPPLTNHHPIITSPSQTLTNLSSCFLPSQTLTNLSSCFLPHPTPTTTESSFKNKKEKSMFICRASSSSSSDVVPAKDRLLSAIAYLLPFFNGLNFGVFLFDRFPILELAFIPFVPLFSFYKSIPGANFMAFLALCFGVVRDRGFSKYVRRNALQATMLDVLLALPSLVNIVFDSNKGLKFRLLEISYGATFLVIVAGFLYAFGLSILGRNPKFPFVSDAVDWQLSAVDRQF